LADSKETTITTNVAKPRKTACRNIEGRQYLVTSVADMAEWMEDLEDIMDSLAAMKEPGESIPFEPVIKDLKLKLPARRKQ
jgi:hypothetical protein